MWYQYKIGQYSLNVKLSKSQRNRLESATKSEAGISLRLSSNMIIAHWSFKAL